MMVMPTKVDFKCKELYHNVMNDTGQPEPNCVIFETSDLKAILQRIIQEGQKNSNSSQPKVLKKLIQELYVHNQYKRGAGVPCTSLLSVNQNLRQQHFGLVKVRTPNSDSVCGGTTPANVSSLKRHNLLDGFGTKRRSKSTSDLGTFLSEQTLAGCLNSAIKCIIEGTAGNDLVKTSLKNHLSSLVSDMSSRRIQSVDALIEETRSGLTHSPGLTTPSRVKRNAGKRRLGSDVTENLFASCPSAKSTSSDQSSSSSYRALSKGILRCTWTAGLPCFEFSVDNRTQVYLANPSRVDSFSSSLSEGFPDYIYTICSRSDVPKVHGSSVDKLSDPIGKLKVSSCLILDSKNLKHVETEYVLFGSRAHHSGELQSSPIAHRKHKGLPKRMVDVFRMHNSTNSKSIPKLRQASQETCADASYEVAEYGKDSPNENECLPSLELAAIVVKQSVRPESQLESTNGWGLNFLKKAPSVSCQGDLCCSNTEPVTSMNVLVPAGLHGGPRSGGPSTLTERWRSGGKCDCGGWDVGCPLTVLSNSKCTVKDASEACGLLDVFTEGLKEGEPTVKIVGVSEDVCFVYFQPTVSPLQSFSIAVAFIHSSSPAFHPTLRRKSNF